MHNTEEFIKKAVKKYSNKYDYSLVNYKGVKYKINIICKKHGLINQTPEAHMRGGCEKCNKYFINTEVFIQKSKLIHGDKYDYSLSNYTTSLNKIKIICKEHGVFEQRANSHYNGANCGICNGYNKTTEIFIKEATEKIW